MSYRPKIKTNKDGSLVDLPLDADTLNGEKKADIIKGLAKQTDVNNGLATKLPMNSVSNYDANTLFNTGTYCVADGTNTPHPYGTLFVQAYRNPSGNTYPDYVTQIWMPNGDSNPNQMWFRTSKSDKFDDWKKVALDEDKANKATTLAGYGITDAYTKSQVNTELGKKVDKEEGKDLTVVRQVYDDNLDNYTLSGFYYFTTGNKNTPLPNTNYWKVIINGSIYDVVQIATQTESGRTFVRGKAGENWLKWKEISNDNVIKELDKRPLKSDVCPVLSPGGYDCDKLYDTCIASIANGTNGPTSYGTLLVQSYRKHQGNTIPDYATQIFIPNGSDVTSDQLWFRTSRDTTWDKWKKVALDNTVQSAIKSLNSKPNLQNAYKQYVDLDTLIPDRDSETNKENRFTVYNHLYNPTHGPRETPGRCGLLIFGYTEESYIQIITTESKDLWYRAFFNATWSQWQKVATTNDVGTKLYLHKIFVELSNYSETVPIVIISHRSTKYLIEKDPSGRIIMKFKDLTNDFPVALYYSNYNFNNIQETIYPIIKGDNGVFYAFMDYSTNSHKWEEYYFDNVYYHTYEPITEIK